MSRFAKLISAATAASALMVASQGCTGPDNPQLPDVPQNQGSPVDTEKKDVKKGGAAPGSSGGMKTNPGAST